ncbi:hypothetical protein ACH4S8_04675 [Streptomyces sp. NPDC021080]|uniref:hypothetical protein n=1 Tax=Streptomyces sp. NPDC021080 TaxID=3365110 RepID=UPI003791B006
MGAWGLVTGFEEGFRGGTRSGIANDIPGSSVRTPTPQSANSELWFGERRYAMQVSGRSESQTILGAAEEEFERAEETVTFDEHRRAPFGSHVTAAQVHLNTARLLWLKSFLSSPDEVAPLFSGVPRRGSGKT